MYTYKLTDMLHLIFTVYMLYNFSNLTFELLTKLNYGISV